ncbi:MAG: tetratricopeptide repeat protein [Candidatus Rifleibacteriota bacterium]
MNEKTEHKSKNNTEDEFFTDAQLDFDTSFEDALILEKFEVAKRQLQEFKKSYGETASYLHRLGRLEEKRGNIKEAYDIFKKLFYEVPVFMRDKYELINLKREHIQNKIDKARAQWNQIVARASRFMEENPEDHGKENSKPYVRMFWDKHYKDIESVAEMFLEILKIEEHELSAILGLVQCYSELSYQEKTSFYKTRVVEAKKYWKAMVSKRSQAVEKAAKKQEDSNNYDNVITVVNLGLETEPGNPILLVMKADALMKLGHYQDALACVYAVLKAKPHDTRAIRLKKTIEAHQFEYNLKQGLDFLFRAEQEKPQSPAQMTRIESALSYFLDALAFDPQNLSALAGIYRCHIRSGQPLKAQKTLERIREIDSSFDVYSIFRDKKDKQADTEGCFIATRLYGEIHPVTEVLRKFRSKVLRKTFPGRVFIRLYRRVGPALAELPGKSPLYKILRYLIGAFADICKRYN